LAFELDQAAGGLELLEVVFAVEGGAHAGVVGDQGDGGADAAAEWFAVGAAAEVVVAVPSGSGHELQLARARRRRSRPRSVFAKALV